jgi:beta-glucosidase
MGDDVQELLSQLSRAEKAGLTGGTTYWETTGVPRLGIAPLLTSDGPNGVRGARWGDISMCLPAPTALAASWNPSLVEEVGTVLGAEAQDIGVRILLAPNVNLHRHPLGGRSFECFSEDPMLSAAMAVAYVKGVQSTGVASSIKHLVCNDQETERMSIDVEVDERALRELYLAPFEAAVTQAGVWSVMAAYNRFRGVYCSENAPLLLGILKEEWGFDGMVVSDYWGTHAAEAVSAGLDLEMPGPPQWMGEHLLLALEEGRVVQEAVDEAAARMLRLIRRTGPSPRPLPTREQRVALARRAAGEGIVLLRNEGVLPLEAGRTGTVALIGPVAGRLCPQGGGAAEVTPPYVRNPLESLRSRLGAAEVLHEPGCVLPGPLPFVGPAGLEAPGGVQGVDVEYFASTDLSGEVVFRESFPQTRLIWSGPPHPALDVGVFSARVATSFSPDETGVWELGLTAVGMARALVDGEVILDNEGIAMGGSFFSLGTDEVITSLELTAGRPISIELEYRIDYEGLPLAGVCLGIQFRPDEDALERAVEAARLAETALVFVGTHNQAESEGEDRSSLELQGEQEALIRAVAAVNERTVVVVNSGAPVAMEWADEVAGILQVWYPGQEGGEAIADVLFGEIDASGRLPTTIPRRIEDTPAYPTFPGSDGVTRYDESIFVGYRHYDSSGIEPRFCFGHGLSYTSVEYRDLVLSEGEDGVELSFELANVGRRPGAAVAQVYVRRPDSGLVRADRELKAFEKRFLEPGETTRVTLTLAPAAFRHWETEAGGWKVEAGQAEILVGESSRDLRLRGVVELAGARLSG